MRKFFLVLIGGIALALGVAGIFLPLLPTTPFLLLAAACFAKSSPRFYRWLIEHPIFGKIIKDWNTKGSIPASAKVLASIALAFSFYSVWTLVPLLPVQIVLTLILLASATFIFTRPSS